MHSCTVQILGCINAPYDLSAVNVFNNSVGRVHSCTVPILRCINAPYDIARRRMARGHPVDVCLQGMCCWEAVWKRLVAKVFLMFRQRLAHSFGFALTDPGSVGARSLSQCRSNCFRHFKKSREAHRFCRPRPVAALVFQRDWHTTIIANGRLPLRSELRPISGSI